MEDSAPVELYALHSLRYREISGLQSIMREVRDVLRRSYDDYLESRKAALGSHIGDGHGHVIEVERLKPKQPHDELPHETLVNRSARYGFWGRCVNRLDVVESKPEQPQDEVPRETQRRGPRARSGRWEASRKHAEVENSKPEKDERSRRLICVADDIDWLRHFVKPMPLQDERQHERSIRQVRDFVAGLDCTNHNSKTTKTERQKIVSVPLNDHVWLLVSASDILATGGMGKTGIGSYVGFPDKQHSESNNYYSQTPPISGNRKAEDLNRGSQGEDRDPNGGMTVITIKDEDEKNDYTYNSSFASAQFLTLGISSILLCLLVLLPNFAQKNQAITGAALMGATLGSLVTLEIILKWPKLARTCGYLAVLCLLVALASLLSSSLDWFTI